MKPRSGEETARDQKSTLWAEFESPLLHFNREGDLAINYKLCIAGSAFRYVILVNFLFIKDHEEALTACPHFLLQSN
jgi:hypothetical protein